MHFATENSFYCLVPKCLNTSHLELKHYKQLNTFLAITLFSSLISKVVTPDSFQT